jgi:hypothetical protein
MTHFLFNFFITASGIKIITDGTPVPTPPDVGLAELILGRENILLEKNRPSEFGVFTKSCTPQPLYVSQPGLATIPRLA